MLWELHFVSSYVSCAVQMRLDKPGAVRNFRKQEEAVMRGHLDKVAATLAAARAAGTAAGASHGGLGYGAAWPAPTSGVDQCKNAAALKRTKAVVRNAERPKTPVHPPADDNAAAHRAATLLQRLLRGRAIQAEMQAAAALQAALITELMTPLDTAGCPLAPPMPQQQSSTLVAVGAIARQTLQCAP